MNMRDVLCFVIIICAGTGGEIAVSRAMKEIGEVHDFSPRNLVRVILRAFRVGWMWIGVGLMALGFFSLMMLLAFENVSFVVPVTALSYAVGAFGGKYLLGERVTAARWMGVLLVCLGVMLVCIG